MTYEPRPGLHSSPFEERGYLPASVLLHMRVWHPHNDDNRAVLRLYERNLLTTKDLL